MQKKTSGKARHVVAWLNKAEWDQVLEYLYSKDIALQKHALHRVSAWKGRFGHSTPVAVESTADLVRCQVLDNSGQLEGDDLVLLYGMALVRFVNLITERQQKKVAKPLRRLASKMNIPEWIVNLRHDLTHRRLPSLKWCRKGCSFILEWLQQEYWSRQLGSRLTEDWDSSSDEEDDWAKNQEEEQLIRQKKIEAHKKARELLLSFEREQFQALQMARRGAQGNVWQEPSADLSWILAQVKHFTADSRETLIDVLLQDGFLIPTMEQLESLDINMSEGAVDVLTPCVPRVFLRFWLPLLKDLNSPSFVNAILDGLFAELRDEPAGHRGYYVAAWIAEILHCNSNRQRKMMKMKDRVFSNRLQLRWKHLITACLNAPCASTPYLLQQIFSDMDKPLPSDTQHNLLRLCSIYTQSGDHGSCSHDNPDPAQPVYTLQSLQERLKGGATHKRLTRLPHHTLGTMQAPPPDHLEEELSTEALQERSMALRGSPWQVCPEKIPWKQYPLGKVPGQSEDPSSLMLESYTTLTVFDQQVELDQLPQHHANSSVPVQHRAGTEGPLWTHSDLSKLKAGLKLF